MKKNEIQNFDFVATPVFADQHHKMCSRMFFFLQKCQIQAKPQQTNWRLQFGVLTFFALKIPYKVSKIFRLQFIVIDHTTENLSEIRCHCKIHTKVF